MSVQSEIDRIRKNVGDTLSVIGGKGVVIPEGAGSNELPALVGALGPQFPALTNPGTAADLAQGKELIGADGTVVKGNVTEISGNGAIVPPIPQAVTGSDVKLELGPNWSGIGPTSILSVTSPKNLLFRAESKPSVCFPLSLLGDATAADVAKGKTFTSTAGVKVVGTAALGKLPIAYKAGVLAANGEEQTLPYAEFSSKTIADAVIVYRRPGEHTKVWLIENLDSISPLDFKTSTDGTVELYRPFPHGFLLRNKGASMEYVVFIMAE